MLEHTALVNDERAAWERIGYTVYTENQNLFRLTGKMATIAGQPDLIAEKHADAAVIDAKTGKASPSHRAQVMIYQYAIPKALTQRQGKRLSGYVRYPKVHVRHPSQPWTSSSKEDCPVRIDGDYIPEGATEDF